MALVARLQKRNMTFGLPYTILNAAAAIDLGMGSKDMFSILLLQNGEVITTTTAGAPRLTMTPPERLSKHGARCITNTVLI